MSKETLKRWHGAHHYPDKIHLLLIVFLFFGVFTLIWSYFTLSDLKFKAFDYKQSKIIKTRIVPSPMLTPTPSPSKNDGVACTMEAKLCPDGKTYVSRSGPNCEFSKCPDAGSPTCIPRPKCLDSVPKCMIAETENMCPPAPSY